MIRLAIIVVLLLTVGHQHKRIEELECRAGLNKYGNTVWNSQARTCVSP